MEVEKYIPRYIYSHSEYNTMANLEDGEISQHTHFLDK